MRPFQQLRFWAQRAPVGERVSAGLAVVVALALIGWLLVPDGSSSKDGLFASDPGWDDPAGTKALEAGDADDPAATGLEGGGLDDGSAPAAAPGAGGGAGAGADGGNGGADGDGTGGPAAGAVQGAGAQGCASPPGSLQGVTDTEVHLAIVLTEIAGPAANALFNIPPPAQARADFEAAIAGINAEGGAACRRLVGHYYITNPTDESSMMALCREISDAGHFAVVDTGSLATRPAVLACFGQLRIPYFGAFLISEKARRQFYPYLFSTYTVDQLYRSTAFALRDMGWFDPANGFEKLGFIVRDCEKEATDGFRAWVREAGVPDDRVVTHSVGCPAVFAPESDLAAAVNRFQRERVSHVLMGGMTGDYQSFTQIAELNRFRPRYAFSDDAIISTSDGARQPNPANMAGALAVTLARDAEQWTPGMGPDTPGTQRCNQHRAAAGLAPVWEVPSNAGNACSQLWMLQAALSNAPELSHAALPVGLQRTGGIDFSFPQGVADFSAQGTTTGGQFFRVAQFESGCQRQCWRVIQPEFRRGGR
jgi:hypothetical protein